MTHDSSGGGPDAADTDAPAIHQSAPPDAGTDAGHGLEDGIPCPFCEGTDTELHNPFGSQLSLATYWCRTCRTAFERLKWQRRVAGAPGASEAPADASDP